MSSLFLISGAHPWLSLAEAKAVISGPAPLQADSMLIFPESDVFEPKTLQDRLAGITKLGMVLETVPLSDLSAERIAGHLKTHPRGPKVLFGLTVYGGSSTVKQRLRRLPIELKRQLQLDGASVRWITGDNGEISTAAIQKMEVLEKGYDLCIGIIGNEAHIGLTEAVQDINSWSLRDFGRPARDSKNGMLPPKLAHLMVNLGLGQLEAKNGTKTLLDPFCGGGTVLMEAGIIDQRLTLIGSDIEAKQIHDSQTNFDWMVEKHLLSAERREAIKLITSPAQTLDQHLVPASVDLIVTEGFLGRPLRGQEILVELEGQQKLIEQLWRDTLGTCAKLQPKGGILVACVPVFKTSHATLAVQFPQDLSAFGYQRLDTLEGWKVNPPTLTYARPDQFVKRNIVVLKRTS